ncbi:MAG: serine hydrolase domain-containing protein [Myxococcota bacterium]
MTGDRIQNPTANATQTQWTPADATSTAAADPSGPVQNSAGAAPTPEPQTSGASTAAPVNKLAAPDAVTDKIKAALATFINDPEHAIPGVTFAVRTPAGDMLQGAVGKHTAALDGSTSVEMHKSTITNRASTSKMITAVMVHKTIEALAKKGVHIDVANTPLRSIRPFQGRSDLEGLTFQKLLTMTAGLSRDTAGLEPALTDDEVGAAGLDPAWENLKRIARPLVRNVADPNEPPTFRYSNQGFNELALLVGELAIAHGLVTSSPNDQPLNPVNAYWALTQRELIRPLGLQNELFYDVPESQRHRIATPYGALKNDADGNPVRARLFEQAPTSRRAQAGSWGLYATDAGLSKFVEALTNAAAGIPTQPVNSSKVPGPIAPVISLESANAIFTPHMIAGSFVYGHGVFPISGTTELEDGSELAYEAIGHSGGSYGSQTYAFTDIATGITVTLATNAPDGDRPAMFKEILAEVAQALKAEGKLAERTGTNIAKLQAFARASAEQEPNVFPPRSELNAAGEARELSAMEIPTFANLPAAIRDALIGAKVVNEDGTPGAPKVLDSDVGFGGRDKVKVAFEPVEGGAPRLALTIYSSARGLEMPVDLRVGEREGQSELIVRQKGAVDFGFANEAVRIFLDNDHDPELHVAFGGRAGTHAWVEEKNDDDRDSPLVRMPTSP